MLADLTIDRGVGRKTLCGTVASPRTGLNVGNIITLPALIVQVEYPPAAYALVVGMVTAIAQFTYAFGPGLQGLLRDLAGAYEPGLVLCMALNAGAALLVLMRPGRRQAAAA